MGKKGKVNKLAKMSDEERIRYLQHRAEMEEEARRKKRELIARFIKNKLDKEEAYSRINTAKLNQAWRFILRKIKCKQMAQDIQGMKDSFDYMVERKNRQVSFLMQAIEDSDDQHRRAFQAHVEVLSDFLGIGSQRLDQLQSDYESRKNDLLESWDKEEAELTERQETAEFKLKLILYIQNSNFQRWKAVNEVQRATKINDEKIEHEEDLRSLLEPRHLQIEAYWSQLRDVYNTFLEHHHPIMGHYELLREKDEFYQRDIARNEVLIQRANDELQALQKQYATSTRMMEDKLQRMNAYKEQLATRYQQLKKQAKVQARRGSVTLEVMVNVSQDAIKHLEDCKAKLDKIWQLVEICRKYETKEEAEQPRDGDSEGIRSPLSLLEFENLDNDMIQEFKQYKKMDKFLLKANRVQVQTVCLKAEKSKLVKENAQLKNYIKRYLTELALKSGQNRPLSMKAESLGQLAASGKAQNRPLTCIEGTLSNAVMHEKRMRALQKQNEELRVRAYPRVQCWM